MNRRQLQTATEQARKRAVQLGEIGDTQEQDNLYDDPAWNEKRTQLFEKMMHHQIAVRILPQYRNLPLVDGMKVTPGGQGNGQLLDPIPIYGDVNETPTW